MALIGADADNQWPQWRGPRVNGTSPTADPPLRWSETQNVKWKTKVPGFGTSTPIVWGQRVFILTAEASTNSSAAEQPGPAADGASGRSQKSLVAHRFSVLCYSRDTGKLLWAQTAREGTPHEGHHPDHGFASASPCTDGERLIAYFGSRGLHCYDLEGHLQWSKDLGRMRTRNSFGEGASPALYRDSVVVNWDDEGDNDFIAAFDKQSGKELWRTPRSEPTGWSTPLIMEYQGKARAVVNATGSVRSYDLATGKELWNCPGQTANAIPTPVANSDTVFVTSGFRGSALFAIALGKTGDLKDTDAIRWTRSKNTPYVPSPLLAGELLYTISMNNPVLTCVDAGSGKPHFEAQKLEGLTGIYASPVSAKDRVYVLGRNGVCLVLKKGPDFEVLATNKVDDKTDASIALAGRDLLIRGHQYLYCIGE
jgi:outer membrane protein assembly factor BamB